MRALQQSPARPVLPLPSRAPLPRPTRTPAAAASSPSGRSSCEAAPSRHKEAAAAPTFHLPPHLLYSWTIFPIKFAIFVKGYMTHETDAIIGCFCDIAAKVRGPPPPSRCVTRPHPHPPASSPDQVIFGLILVGSREAMEGEQTPIAHVSMAIVGLTVRTQPSGRCPSTLTCETLPMCGRHMLTGQRGDWLCCRVWHRRRGRRQAAAPPPLLSCVLRNAG